MRQRSTNETADSVRAELARRRISGRKLATDLGWKQATVARRLNGTYPFTIDELAAIAGYLGVPISALLPERTAA